MRPTPPMFIRDFGVGRVTAHSASLIGAGAARDSLNFLHNQGKNRAKLRVPVNRVWATRPEASAVLAAYEYVKTDLTKVYLAKLNKDLYTFDALTPATALTSILTDQMTEGYIPSIATANGNCFIADSGKNWITRGTAAISHELQKTGPQGTLSLGHRVGTAAGNAAGTVYYSITDLEPNTGEETPPGTAVSIARLVDEGVAITGLTYTGHFTSKRIYRTKAGLLQPYLVTTLTGSTASYNDDSLDTALVTVSEVHDDAGAATIGKPAAAKHLCWHRGRLFMASGTLLWWSRPGEPTQFSNSTDAQLNVGYDDGEEITGLVSFRGSLVVFKTHSIWVLNGDVVETNFTIYPAVIGRGCIAPRTIAADGSAAIYFLSSVGVLMFDLASVKLISDNIAPDFQGLEILTYGARMVGAVDPYELLYLIAVTPKGETTNTKVHAYNIQTGAWGRFSFGMGVIVPTCFSTSSDPGAIRNANGEVKLYVGDSAGYLYETATTAGGDGITSGSASGTVTGYNAGTGVLTCSAASFRTTGDGLKALPVTLRRAADNTFETRTISTNTGTAITPTVITAWSGGNPVAGDTIFIGAYEGLLSLGRIDLGNVYQKRWRRLEVGFEKETHTVPLRVGYTIDDEAAPSATAEYLMNGGQLARKPCHRRGVGFSPYLDIIGVGHDVEIISIAVWAEVLGVQRPLA